MKIVLSHVTKVVETRIDTKNHKSLTILDDISAEFDRSRISAVIGPSGSGKTTLLRMLNRLDSPTSGKIFLDGVEISQIEPRVLRRRVGMVFQVPALFRGTILDNIIYGPKLNGLDCSLEKAGKLLKHVGLSNLQLEQNVENLSLGQQQRIAFARALANEPEVLLLDEPTSALDPTSANNLLDLILKINRELGIKIIMVTHIMLHARRIADDVFLLVNGKLVESGNSKDFFSNPSTELARKFIIGELQ